VKTNPDPKPSLLSLAAWLAFFALLAYVIVSATGCASVSQLGETTITAPDGTVTRSTARTSIRALGDAKNSVEKIRASAGKTVSLGAAGVDEETKSPAALVELLNKFYEAGKAAAKP
jgi:hypothetical protein